MTVQWTVFMSMRATGTASVGNSILTVLVILLRYYILFGTHAPGWSCPLGAGTSNRWSLFATPVKWNWNLELLFMRLNSYAPTSSLEILLWSSSCKWKGNLAHQQSQEDPDVAHQRLVQGLSVAKKLKQERSLDQREWQLYHVIWGVMILDQVWI